MLQFEGMNYLWKQNVFDQIIKLAITSSERISISIHMNIDGTAVPLRHWGQRRFWWLRGGWWFLCFFPRFLCFVNKCITILPYCRLAVPPGKYWHLQNCMRKQGLNLTLVLGCPKSHEKRREEPGIPHPKLEFANHKDTMPLVFYIDVLH